MYTGITNSVVRVEVEQVDNDSNDRWNGEFSSQCEDYTYNDLHRYMNNDLYIYEFL
jgi:hypothetical protein